MITALITEDDRLFAELLAEELEATGRVTVVGVASSGRECMSLLEEVTPDLLLLDIDMPEMTGIEVAEMVVSFDSPPLIVFVTGHDQYAAKAFDLRAVDYVVKPMDMSGLRPRLLDMLDHVGEHLADRPAAIENLRQRVNTLAEAVHGISGGAHGSVQGRLPVKDYDEGTLVLLPTESISHAVRSGRNVMIHADGKQYRTNHTIDKLTRRLGPEGFVGVSAGAVANLRYITQMIPNGDGTYDVFLSDPDETTLVATRTRAATLLERLGV